MTKRLLALLVCICLLIPAAGCSLFSEEIQEPVQFYYLRESYLYGQEDAVIRAEERDGTGHIKDPEYLLQLYLMGPHEEKLISPFPSGLQIVNIVTGREGVRIALSDPKGTLSAMPEIRKTVVFSCLALTCFDITGIPTVTIAWDDEIVAMTQDSLTLFDSSALQNSQHIRGELP